MINDWMIQLFGAGKCQVMCIRKGKHRDGLVVRVYVCVCVCVVSREIEIYTLILE